jgi:hypothetical protein
MEIPCGTGYNVDRLRGPSLSDTTTLWDAHRKTTNPYEALQSADFDEYPDVPGESLFLSEMESLLTPKELAVVSFVTYGQMSFSQAGRYLGAEFPRKGQPTPFSKNAVRNIYVRAINKMRKHLEEPHVEESELEPVSE